MKLDLNDKKALITGASAGIGFAVAHAFAREGCRLHIVSRSADRLSCARRALCESGATEVETQSLDLSQPESSDALFAACPDADIVVNNAGSVSPGSIEDLPERTWRESFDLKVFAYIAIARTYYMRMKERAAGVIVNNIGNAGEIHDPQYIAGATANSALMAFTRVLGGTSLEHGVRVLGVNPGPVATERLVGFAKRRASNKWGDPSRWPDIYASFPHGAPATAEDIANLIVFLASDRARYISGAVVTVDGGLAYRGSVMPNI